MSKKKTLIRQFLSEKLTNFWACLSGKFHVVLVIPGEVGAKAPVSDSFSKVLFCLFLQNYCGAIA